MSERMDQARAEAARDAFYQARWEQKKPLDSVRFGVEWADANPRPRTITRAEFLEALDAHVGLGASGDWVTVEDMLIAAFMAAGIEVRDD